MYNLLSFAPAKFKKVTLGEMKNSYAIEWHIFQKSYLLS